MASEPISTSGLTSEPIVNLSTTPVHRDPPTVTTSSFPSYLQACALSNQFASRNDPMTLLFQAEKLPPLPNEPQIAPNDSTSKAACDILRTRLSTLSNDAITQMIYDSGITRMTAKCVSDNAFVAEAGGFAAVTCWERQFAPQPPVDWKSRYGPDKPDVDLSNIIDELKSNGVPMSHIIREKPVFGAFWMNMEIAKYKYLYPLIWRAAQEKAKKSSVANGVISKSPSSDFTLGINSNEPQSTPDQTHLQYWYICLTSRNPTVQPPVPGAVRAVIEPIVKRLVHDEGIPAVWIMASNERARDVYGYLGFRVVSEFVVGVGEGGKEIVTWCMVYTKEG